MRRLLILKAVSSGNGWRLGFSEKDFKKFQDRPIDSVKVDIRKGELIECALQTHVKYGSLTNPGINEWIKQNEEEFVNNRALLLFDMNESEGTRILTFIGTRKEVQALFEVAEDAMRKKIESTDDK